MRNLLVAFVLLVVLSSEANAQTDEVIIYGPGAKSCGAWLQARAARDDGVDYVSYFAFSGWLSGYMSGYNVFFPPSPGDVIEGTDREGVDAWLDKYCRENPTNPFFDAADALIEHLESRT